MVRRNAGVPLCSATSEILARPHHDVPTEGRGFVDYFTELMVLGGFNSQFILFVFFGLNTSIRKQLCPKWADTHAHNWGDTCPTKATGNHARRRQGRAYASFKWKTLSGSDPVALLQAENQSAGRRNTSAAVKYLPHVNVNYSFRRPHQQMTESLISEMLHKQPESCLIHSFFPSSFP